MLKVSIGDRLEYIGPPRDRYTGPKDHPSYYRDYVVVEIKEDFYTRLDPTNFNVRTECLNPQGEACTRWRCLPETHWKIIGDS